MIVFPFSVILIGAMIAVTFTGLSLSSSLKSKHGTLKTRAFISLSTFTPPVA
jgi:hypothetical protein